MNEPLNDPENDRIIKSLSALQNVAPRSPDAEKSGRARFLHEAAVLRRNRFASCQKRQFDPRSILPFLFSRAARPIWIAAAAVFMAMILILTSGGAVVYASQGSLPGQALYPLKLYTEDLRLDLANSPQSQLKLNLEFANRRLDEIDQLAAVGQAPTDDVIDRLQDELDNSIQGTSGLDDAEARPALENLRNNLQRHTDQLVKLESQANPRAAAEFARVVEMLKARVALAEQGIKDPQALHQLMKEQKEQIKEQINKQSGETAEVQPSDTTTATEEPSATETPKDKNQNPCKGQGKGNNCNLNPQLTAVPEDIITETPAHGKPTARPTKTNQGNGNGADHDNNPKK
jgi:hypothetical protein